MIQMTNDVYVEIDNKIIGNNIKNIIKKYNNYKYYIGVVKGNCYGHGIGIIPTLIDNGINYLATSTLEESLELRKITDIPILCMQPINIKDIQLASINNITITVSSYDYFKELIKNNYKLTIHLKLDTGMNRLGINNRDDFNKIYKEIKSCDYLTLEGLYTHMQTTGITDKKWDLQINKFLQITKDIDLENIKIVHIYNTNGLVIHPKLDFCNGVRMGIIMYGIAPRGINYNGFKGKIRKYKHEYLRKKQHLSPILNDYNIDIKPGFKLLSKIIEIKDINANEYIGYGLNYKTTHNSKIAVASIGYADGLNLNHTLSYVTINNQKYQIVGSINMKMITILVDDNVKIDDTVEIINNNVREICAHDHITPHYLFTTIPKNIKRIYLNTDRNE